MRAIATTLLIFFSAFASAQAQTPPPIEVYFSPHGGCTEAIVRQIGSAQNSILVQAYSFTSAPIAKALVDAHKRGVKVQVILDGSQRTAQYSEADFLTNMGIATLIDDKHAIAHNKVIIVDQHVVITGSFNFSRAAEERNAENLLVISDDKIAQKYFTNWQLHARHSEPYTSRANRSSDSRPVPSQNGYVASKNSKVFHRPDCSSAAKIFPKNIVRYATRQQALQAGRRPCAECRP
jgi:phosphatidylserine/phosphatidylglycerophosphate/cardiolipin synthase-like enzyme